MPSNIDSETIRIIVDPGKLYTFKGHLYSPEAGDYSKAAAVIEAHGGEIEADSEVGKAAVFTIRLPIAPAPPAAGPSALRQELKAESRAEPRKDLGTLSESIPSSSPAGMADSTTV